MNNVTHRERMLDEIGYDEFVGGWFEYARNIRVKDRLRQVLFKFLSVWVRESDKVCLVIELLQGTLQFFLV